MATRIKAPPETGTKRRHLRREFDPVLGLVGKQLRAARLAAGYSQEAFAHETGLDRSYWGAVERGLVNIGILNLINVAETLRCEAADLLPTQHAIHQARRKKP